MGKTAAVKPYWVALALLAACGRPPFTDPHRHVVDVHARPWTIEGATEARIVRAAAPAGLEKKEVAENPGRTARAYVVNMPIGPNAYRERIFIDDLAARETFEIVDIPLPHRPYSDLVWLDGRHLAFDRWSSPHYGIHYVVDAATRRLVLARPFPDQFYLDMQDPNRN
jgi:hypothetical protein